MSLPPVRKRKDYSDISKDDLVFALFYDRIAPTDALSEQGEERKSIAALAEPTPAAVEAMTALGIAGAQAGAALRDTLASDLAAWRRKAIKAVKDGKGASVKFVSGAIPEEEQARIREGLAEAKTIGDVVGVFDAQTNQRDVVGAVGGTPAHIRRDTVAASPADLARLDNEQGHVKATALDEELDALIDEELDAALAWAQKATQDE